MNRILRLVATVSAVLLLLVSSALARGPRVIDDNDRVVLRGNVHPNASPEFDAGPADPALPMERMILTLQLSPDKQAELDRLLSGQQDPASPDYHRWLTPEEFGNRFGPAPEGVTAVTGWLASHGFTVEEVGKGRTWINFSGTAAHVERTFHTQIRNYRVNGRLHHANATDPEIPRGLADLVRGIVSLHNFPRKPMNHRPKTFKSAADAQSSHPDYNYGGSHYLSPGDFATIYNLKPLYESGIDGTGVTVAIVGRCNIHVSDVQTFRSRYGLPARDPIIVANGTDPGVWDTGEETEAILDVEWSGAVAKNATIKLVVSASTQTTDGVDLSAQYIVNHNLAPVMSTSFGSCESQMANAGTGGNAFYNSLWQQAAAQGITSFVSTGDSGAADCVVTDGSGNVASWSKGVNGLASTPFNVAVGGSEFNEGAGTYWNSSNDINGVSALGYIPEAAWNESGTAGYCPADVAPCSGLWATGGGVSTIYGKPSWQVVPGVPADGKRDIPDVSLTASTHVAYLIYQSDQNSSQSFVPIGGTSASSPALAGVMALIVQKTGKGQGNANERFYQLGNAQYGANGVKVFNDVTSGNNSVPGVTGFAATTGYDLATGLGSVNAAALLNSWALTDLTVTVSHAGSFSQGQSGAAYTLTVRNSGTGTTNGTAVTVTDTLPAGLTATALSGNGWSCTLAALTCTRTDALAPGGSYPPITLTVNVAANAPASLANSARVSGGGETNTANDTYSDSTTITPVYTLNLLFAGNGAGTVTNQATATACNANCSSAPIASNTSVTLHAAPDQYSNFSGWSTCAGTGDCTFTMNGDASVTASFSINSARSVLCGSAYYPTILAAYQDAPQANAIIEAWGIAFPEAPNFDLDKSFTLRGGFDGTYTTTTGTTVLAPPLTITSGMVTVENVTVQ